MKREDAIFFLNELRSANNCDETIDMAISALSGWVRTAWVRTADRLPTDEDGDTNMVLCGYPVPAFNGNKPFYAYELSTKYAVCNSPEYHPLWLPLPPLPETAGAEGTKING